MSNKNITFAADEITVSGVYVSAKGVPIADILGNVEADDAADHIDNILLLQAIGKEKVIAWLEEQDFKVI
ncbi:hypothetical protein SBX64_15880 [Vibrio rhizosphaerae]|uniref:Uncharacterized protein n=1 Tax=Vibrio rhizosphaerae TaxID=398736 RepID=A0ABU4IXW8_9VIBR|nr:hypothetical protein [Vibrio rhizosphaerae]MDW6094018.1 hypothetical protein [Vibrio rhizosphaerae]